MRKVCIAVVGAPNVGKLTLLQRLSEGSSSRIERRKARFDDEYFGAIPAVIRTTVVVIDSVCAELSCVSGNMPVAASLPLFRSATHGIFVFDSQPAWYSSQRVAWQQVQDHLPLKHWAFIISKRDLHEVIDPDSFFAEHGVTAKRPTLHLSLLAPDAPTLLLRHIQSYLFCD